MGSVLLIIYNGLKMETVSISNMLTVCLHIHSAIIWNRILIRIEVSWKLRIFL